MEKLNVDIVIIGAGAAGLMAGYFASLKGKKVIILEHNDRVGRKILISGGGRCNFTNIHSSKEDFESLNPGFCDFALSKFKPNDFLKMTQKYKINYYEKKLGQLFCKNSAKDIVDMLLRNIHENKVKILLNQKNLDIEKKECFEISNDRIQIKAPKVIIATGGLSIPTIGASDFGFKIAKKFGHKLIHTEPALVPFKYPGFDKLAGVALVGNITCNNKEICEDILFTHKGFSGPAILKISLYWKPGDKISINWLPELKLSELKNSQNQNKTLKEVIKNHLPKKFIQHFLDDSILNTKISTFNEDQFLRLKSIIYAMDITPTGTEGFRKAEVTRGGVDTKDISPKTMESLKEPGLYFIGEVLDVTGQLGGHNFQWAWASAFVAGQDLQ